LRKTAAYRQIDALLDSRLQPFLVEDGLVQTRLGPNVLARFLGVARRRPGHVPHLQVLDTRHRVVFADRDRGLVQEVLPGVADPGVDVLSLGLRFLPVVAELYAFCAPS